MSKRKAEVNDIIFEIDSEDIDSSSEDENNILNTNTEEEGAPKAKRCNNHDEKELEVVNVESSGDEAIELVQLDPDIPNGTQYISSSQHSNNVILDDREDIDINVSVDDIRTCSPEEPKCDNFEEDIIVDSPTSSCSINVVAGCENRCPLITVKFRDNTVAKDYKTKIKEFLLHLMKLHDEEHLTGSETETDLELDIWPEDLCRDKKEERTQDIEVDSLFFVDTAPNENDGNEVPQYSQALNALSNEQEKEPSIEAVRRGPSCFNCEGAHTLRECQLPRNAVRIAMKRKATAKLGRYHVEDDQRFGHLTAGRISGQLRHALGLKRDEIPMYIYRMRMLGYPPGWLEEAKISHSGITMFDSMGKVIIDPEEEEGEFCEPGSKDKYDIKKILDFPGFNVPLSSRYKERGEAYGFPPMTEQDSKLNMLQVLAPNAMMAYKRKKLTFFPSASPNNSVLEGAAEMELDDGDEIADFPTLPPLPDDAPPPMPLPPPDSPPHMPALPPDSPIPLPSSSPPPFCNNSSVRSPPESVSSPLSIQATVPETCNDKASSDVMEISDNEEKIDVVGVDDDEEEGECKSGRSSPTLADLETKKRLLLEALDSKAVISDVVQDLPLPASNITEQTATSPEINIIVDDSEIKEDEPVKTNNEPELKTVLEPQTTETHEQQTKSELLHTPDKVVVVVSNSHPHASSVLDNSVDESSGNSTAPQSSKPFDKGHVMTTCYGTPVLNTASSYSCLPSDDKFAKDICDVINFENLPNSTGKYAKISHLLRRVKNEVDRIQEA